MRVVTFRVAYVTCAALALAGVLSVTGNAADAEQDGKVLRHVVLFKFNEGADEAAIKEVTDAFAALPASIEEIIEFEWGTDVSVENLSKGFTHCFIVSFANAEGRDAYLVHPAHDDFVRIAGPKLAEALVVDYWATK